MSGIRKQSIYSSLLVYIGVLIGAINTYFFIKEGSFTKDQYGLTRVFFDIGQNFFVIASLGVIPVLYKFYPYYKDNLPDKENDLLTRSFVRAFIGFALVCLVGYFAEPLFIRKYSGNSPMLVDYYFWIFPFSFGLLFFSILEGYTWALQKTVISNFLRETAMRLFTLVFILLYYFHFINFEQFVWLFAIQYFLLMLILLGYLLWNGKIHFNFKKSRVSKKYKKKMRSMQTLIFGGICIQTLGLTIDGILIASLKGLGQAGIFSLAQYAANLIQIPQRSIQSIATGVLARAWKDKNYAEISRIYQRSSINMLLLSLFIFGNVWLNAAHGLTLLNIQDDYRSGLQVMLVLGILKIIDAGTGVNGIIIGTSTFWKFEFTSGVVMLSLRIPITYILIKQYGILGSAIAELISYSVYNFIRFEFIRRKFNMQPFNAKTAYSLILGLVGFFLAYLLFKETEGWLAMFLRSAVFSLIMITGTFYLKLTPDSHQLFELAKEKVAKWRKK